MVLYDRLIIIVNELFIDDLNIISAATVTVNTFFYFPSCYRLTEYGTVNSG